MELARHGTGLAGWTGRIGLSVLLAGGALTFGILFAYSPLVVSGAFAGLVLLIWQATRRLEWAALALFLVVPLGRLTWIDDTGTLDMTKLLVAWAAVVWAIRSILRHDRTLISIWTESPVSVFLLFFFLAGLISWLGAYDLARSVIGTLRLLALFGMFTVIVALVRSKRHVKIALAFLLVSGAISCLIGVWEVRSHQYLWTRLGQQKADAPTSITVQRGSLANALAMEEEDLPSTMRIMSTFTDFNLMGGYMGVLLGITAGCFLADRRWYLRLALLGMFALIAYDTVKTGSRGGLIGVAVTALCLLLLSRLRLRWFILIAVVTAAIMAFPIIDQLAPQYRGGISLHALEKDQRYGYWQMAFRMIADHPWVGVGTDNYPALYPFYRVSPALMRSYYCHNIYLQMWAESGLPGLFAILGLMGTAGASFFSALRRTHDEHWRCLVLGLFAAFVGYAAFSATCNTLRDQPFWLLMALSIIVLRATRHEGAPGIPARLALPAQSAA